MDAPGTTARAATTRPAAQTGFSRWRRAHHDVIEAWVILSPILLYYSIFFLFPVIADVYVSFTKWNGIVGAPQWVGLANYRAFVKPPYPLTLFNTILFAFTILILQTVIAFVIAVILNEKVIGRGVYRALWYIPTLTSAAVTAQVMFAFISPYDGVLNAVLKALGRPIVIWNLDPNYMRGFIILFSVWRGVGGPVVLFLAALQGIHREVYEAAMVDGASWGKMLRYITWPLLKPMTVFILITGTIGGFQIFETVMLISAGGQANVASSGGPRGMTNVLLLQIYKDAFGSFDLGRAAAGSVVMAILLLWFSTWNMRVLNRGYIAER